MIFKDTSFDVSTGNSEGGSIRRRIHPSRSVFRRGRIKHPVRERKERSSKKGSGGVYPSHLLQTVLYQNGISVLMSANHKVMGLSSGDISLRNLDGGYEVTTGVYVEEGKYGV